jgi:hypothetical protein
MATKSSERTDKKLLFAELTLNEIMSYQHFGSADDFERAHEESYFYHIVGVKDSFLQEINEAYKLGLPGNQVKELALAKQLDANKLHSTELDEIINLKSNSTGWLAIAIKLRNQGTHRTNIPRHFIEVVGSKTSSTRYFVDPVTNQRLETDIPTFMKQCLNEMKALVNGLRSTLP